MGKYRKKVSIIEAFRWTADVDQTEDPEWICEAIRIGVVRFENAGTPDVVMVIDTFEGTHKAVRGDYIIRKHTNRIDWFELCPCKPDVFEATYEKVS